MHSESVSVTAKMLGKIGGGSAAATAAVATVVMIIIVAANSADAGRYARSEKPFWHVGHPDADLTDACRRSQFNQIHDQRHHIGFTGKDGPGTVGFAKQGWNLRDPLGMARPGVTYHFFNDGHSNCKVFVAKD